MTDEELKSYLIEMDVFHENLFGMLVSESTRDLAFEILKNQSYIAAEDVLNYYFRRKYSVSEYRDLEEMFYSDNL